MCLRDIIETRSQPRQRAQKVNTRHKRSTTRQQPLRAFSMSYHQGGGRENKKRVLLPPINFIFKLLQQRSTVQIWLYEQLGLRIEGKIRGFDEYMNLVIDDAVEIKQPTKANPTPEAAPDKGRRQLGERWDVDGER